MWNTIIMPILKEIGITIAKGAGLGLGAALSMKAVDKAFPDKSNNDLMSTAEKIVTAAETTANKISEEKASTDAKISEIKKSMAESQSAMNSEILSMKKSVNDFQESTDNSISILTKSITETQSAMVSEIASKVISELKPKSTVAKKSTVRRKKATERKVAIITG